MNMGMETIVPDLDELIVALFLYVLIPFGIPLVAGIISAHRMPNVNLGSGVGAGSVIGIGTLIAFALVGWTLGFHMLTSLLWSWGPLAPDVAPPLVFAVAGAILSWRYICIQNEKAAAGSGATPQTVEQQVENG